MYGPLFEQLKKGELSEAEYETRMKSLEKKINAGHELDVEERMDWCYPLRPEERKKFSICDEARFVQAIINEVDNWTRHAHMKVEDKITLEESAKEWELSFNKTNHDEDALRVMAKEIRDQLKIINKRDDLDDGQKTNLTAQVVNDGRYTYVRLAYLFRDVKRNSLIVDRGNELPILINESSIGHIYMRHSTPMKKSHLHGKTFLDERIPLLGKVHLFFLDMITAIHKSGYAKCLLKTGIVKIQGKIFQFRFVQATEALQGQGDQPVMRLRSFYPLENPEYFAAKVRAGKWRAIDKNTKVLCP